MISEIWRHALFMSKSVVACVCLTLRLNDVMAITHSSSPSVKTAPTSFHRTAIFQRAFFSAIIVDNSIVRLSLRLPASSQEMINVQIKLKLSTAARLGSAPRGDYFGPKMQSTELKPNLSF